MFIKMCPIFVNCRCVLMNLIFKVVLLFTMYEIPSAQHVWSSGSSPGLLSARQA